MTKEKEPIPCVRLVCDSCHISVAYKGQYSQEVAEKDRQQAHPEDGHITRIFVDENGPQPEEVVVDCSLSKIPRA